MDNGLIARLKAGAEAASKQQDERDALIAEAVRRLIRLYSSQDDVSEEIQQVESALSQLAPGTALEDLVLLDADLTPDQKLTFFTQHVQSWEFFHTTVHRYGEKREGWPAALGEIPKLLSGLNGIEDPNWRRLIKLILRDLDNYRLDDKLPTLIAKLCPGSWTLLCEGDFTLKVPGLIYLEIIRHFSDSLEVDPHRLAYGANQLTLEFRRQFSSPAHFLLSWEAFQEGARALPDVVRRTCGAAALLALGGPVDESYRQERRKDAEARDRIAAEALALLS